jgi:hypothetical protein
MSVLAMVVVTQWAEAELAATPIDTRPWIAHLVDRLRRARTVSEIAVVCQPACHAVVAPHVPPDVACLVATEPLAWAAARGADLVAEVPVWQLFADPARLDVLASTPRDGRATGLRAVLDHDPALVLSGGTDVTIFTAAGLRIAAAGADVGPGLIDVPSAPPPPEVWLRGVVDAAWGVTLQRALLAHGCEGDLGAVDRVLARERLHRLTMWRDGAGRPPRRVLTMRCLPERDTRWLVAHLGHLPGVALDVVVPANLAAATAGLPGVHDVIAFEGRSFDLATFDRATLAAIRERRYDLCVIPRRTPCGRGFENVTPLGAASGAGLAVWMDLTGATGVLAGRPYGWEPWVTADPPWQQVEALTAGARLALGAFTGSAAANVPVPMDGPEPAAMVDAILRRLDETVTCHALVDAIDHGLDLTPAFVHQMPGVAAATAAAAQVQQQARHSRTALAAALDRAWRTAVAHVADAPAGARARQAGDDARHFTDGVAAAARAVADAASGSPAEARALVALERAVAARPGLEPSR